MVDISVVNGVYKTSLGGAPPWKHPCAKTSIARMLDWPHPLRQKWGHGRWENDRLPLVRTRHFFWLVVWNLFYFPHSWDDDPIWLFFFFKGVDTTNQFLYVRIATKNKMGIWSTNNRYALVIRKNTSQVRWVLFNSCYLTSLLVETTGLTGLLDGSPCF